jgi:hypothetical protein
MRGSLLQCSDARLWHIPAMRRSDREWADSALREVPLP